MRTRRRQLQGVTLAEVLFASVLTALIVGALVAVYGFVVVRTSHAFASSNAVNQAESAVEEMSRYVRNAKSCTTVTSGSVRALVCLMPARSVDKNGDGAPESYEPSKVRGLSREAFDDGDRVWFYLGDPTKDFGSTGTTLCMAIRYDDATPRAADVRREWSYYYDNTTSRWNLIQFFEPVVDSVACSTTLRVKASTLIRAERQPDASTPSTERYDHTVARTVFWRSWRP